MLLVNSQGTLILINSVLQVFKSYLLSALWPKQPYFRMNCYPESCAWQTFKMGHFFELKIMFLKIDIFNYLNKLTACEHGVVKGKKCHIAINIWIYFIHLLTDLLLQSIEVNCVGISCCFIPTAILLDRLGSEIMTGSKIPSSHARGQTWVRIFLPYYVTLLYHSDYLEEKRQSAHLYLRVMKKLC